MLVFNPKQGEWAAIVCGKFRRGLLNLDAAAAPPARADAAQLLHAAIYSPS